MFFVFSSSNFHLLGQETEHVLSFLHPIFISWVWKTEHVFTFLHPILICWVRKLTEHVLTFLHPIFIYWVRKLSMFFVFSSSNFHLLGLENWACFHFSSSNFQFLGQETEHVLSFLHPIFICWVWKTEHVLTFLHPIFICWVWKKLSMFCLFFIQFSFVGSGKWATHGVALNRLGNTTSIVTELTRQVSESACDKVWVHEAAIPQLLMIWPKNVCSCGQILKQKWGWKMGKKFNVLVGTCNSS